MIYGFVWDNDDSVVKIGYTGSPNEEPCQRSAASRMGNMQTGHWRELLCIAMSPGTIQNEHALHDKFSHYHVRGEWFLNFGDVAGWVQRHAVVPLRLSDVAKRRPAQSGRALKPHRRPRTTPGLDLSRRWSDATIARELDARSRAVRELDEIASASRRLREQMPAHKPKGSVIPIDAIQPIKSRQTESDERQTAMLEEWLKASVGS